MCVDVGLKKQAALGSILSNDKWDDILHNMNSDNNVKASYMQTNCLEIALSEADLEEGLSNAEAEMRRTKFAPFLHWGAENVLEWRARWVEEIKKCGPRTRGWPLKPADIAVSFPGLDLEHEPKRFYVDLMATQLPDPTKPLHLRRTLDQWYYSTTCDTSKARDTDQIVSKFDPDRRNKGKRALLVVDQLWLWLLGCE
ncbi:hypothetical protein OQA88_35 [Cercophora sp. LCS_1]